jgi:hypothetical protein
MNDALFVCGGEGIGNRDSVAKHLIHGQPTRSQEIGKRVAFEVFHDNVVNAVLGSDVVQSADVGMVQVRDGAGFAFEASSGLDVGRDLWKQNLDGHPATESYILCSVHFTHAACAKKGVEAIRADFGASLETLGNRQSLSNAVLAMVGLDA